MKIEMICVHGLRNGKGKLFTLAALEWFPPCNPVKIKLFMTPDLDHMLQVLPLQVLLSFFF